MNIPGNTLLAPVYEMSMRVISRVAVAAAMAGVLLSGCVEGQSHPVTPEITTSSPSPEATPQPKETAKPETAPARTTYNEACKQFIEYGAAIALDECVELPPIQPGSFTKVKSPQKGFEKCDTKQDTLVGYIRQDANQKTDLTGTPPAQAAALRATVEHPVTKELLSYAEGGVYFYATPDGDWSGIYDDVPKAKESRQSADIVSICSEVGGDNVFNTPAGMRMVATHEGSHAAHFQLLDIAKGKGPKARAAAAELKNLQQICHEEFRLIVEQFRAAHEQEATAVLLKMRTEFAGIKRWDYTKAIDELLWRFKAQDGLHDLMVRKGKDFDVSYEGLYFLIDQLRAGKGHKLPKKLIYDLKLKSVDDWSDIDMKMDAFFNQAMGYTKEGEVFKGMTSQYAGHPTNVTENVASGVAATQLHPKSVTKNVNKLDQAHRILVSEKFASMQRLMVMLNPEMAAQMNLGKVADSIVRYDDQLKRQVYAQVDTQITLADGDWRQLPANRARVPATV